MRARAWGVVGVVLVLVSVGGCKTTPRKGLTDFSELASFEPKVSDYQIGPVWSKRNVAELYPLSSPDLMKEKAPPAIRRGVLGAGRIGVPKGIATGFVLGEKNGEIIGVTSAHVLSTKEDCEDADTHMNFRGYPTQSSYVRTKCKRILVSDVNYDITLFALEIKDLWKEDPEKLRSLLLENARSFSPAPPRKGQKLMTFGYGVVDNLGQTKIMYAQDEDCKTFSRDGEVRLMKDPDTVRPGPNNVWAFAIGCDISHGDSGSAILDYETGDVVGILWTAKVPKNEKVRDEGYLRRIYDESSEDIWTELTYAIPSSKIVEKFGAFLPNP
jgi:hypothetical protein